MFLFQIGAIKSRQCEKPIQLVFRFYSKLVRLKVSVREIEQRVRPVRFYSKLVRLKGFWDNVNSASIYVSIPNWCD